MLLSLQSHCCVALAVERARCRWLCTLSINPFIISPTADAGQVRRSDVMSAWSGIRPLASDPSTQDTASASRDHVASMDTDGMITIAGCDALSRGFLTQSDAWLSYC